MCYAVIFTSDLPLALRKVCVSIYADNSTLYMSATTANEITSTFNNKEQESVLEWMASNKLVLYKKRKELYLGQIIC